MTAARTEPSSPHPEVRAQRASKDALVHAAPDRRCVLRGSSLRLAPQHEERASAIARARTRPCRPSPSSAPASSAAPGPSSSPGPAGTCACPIRARGARGRAAAHPRGARRACRGRPRRRPGGRRGAGLGGAVARGGRRRRRPRAGERARAGRGQARASSPSSTALAPPRRDPRLLDLGDRRLAVHRGPRRPRALPRRASGEPAASRADRRALRRALDRRRTSIARARRDLRERRPGADRREAGDRRLRAQPAAGRAAGGGLPARRRRRRQRRRISTRRSRDGLGLRWSFMGPFETIELNAPGGIPDYCARYGAFFRRYHRPIRRRRRVWDEANIARVTAGLGHGRRRKTRLRAAPPGATSASRRSWRTSARNPTVDD